MRLQVKSHLARLAIRAILSVIPGSSPVAAAMNEPVRIEAGLVSGASVQNPSITVCGSYPETAIFRLIDQNGRPSVKLSASERGGALALVSDVEDTYAQLSGRGLTVTKEGRHQAIP
jgi:hypothetical protein